MKKYFFLIIIIITIISCAPVLRQDIMETAIREFSLSDIKNNPDPYKGKLFVLGGSIVNTKFTQEGSQVEALYIPVDSRGYLKNEEPSSSDGRFLAILPKAQGTLDPLIYRKDRDVTVAGESVGTRSGKIDEVEYTYPVFKIVQIYLWGKKKEYYPYSYYPYPYWWYDPWWRPWGPSWGPYPYYWW